MSEPILYIESIHKKMHVSGELKKLLEEFYGEEIDQTFKIKFTVALKAFLRGYNILASCNIGAEFNEVSDEIGELFLLNDDYTTYNIKIEKED